MASDMVCEERFSRSTHHADTELLRPEKLLRPDHVPKGTSTIGTPWINPFITETMTCHASRITDFSSTLHREEQSLEL